MTALPVDDPIAHRAGETLNHPILYGMIGFLILAVIVPPWEAPPSRPPAFLGFGSLWGPPEPEAVVSRPLLTIEVTMIGVAGLSLSWLFRKRR